MKGGWNTRLQQYSYDTAPPILAKQLLVLYKKII